MKRMTRRLLLVLVMLGSAPAIDGCSGVAFGAGYDYGYGYGYGYGYDPYYYNGTMPPGYYGGGFYGRPY